MDGRNPALEEGRGGLLKLYCAGRAIHLQAMLCLGCRICNNLSRYLDLQLSTEHVLCPRELTFFLPRLFVSSQIEIVLMSNQAQVSRRVLFPSVFAVYTLWLLGEDRQVALRRGCGMTIDSSCRTLSFCIIPLFRALRCSQAGIYNHTYAA